MVVWRGEGHRECGWSYGEGRVKARKLMEVVMEAIVTVVPPQCKL